jgi:HSP20 family molecular chaperone IbpA
MTNKILDKIIGNVMGSAIKMIEKEITRDMTNLNKQPLPQNFRLMVNGKEIPLGKRTPVKKIKKEIKEIKEMPNKSFSEKQRRLFSKLDKAEPKTNLKRLPNKIIYEISMPGVNSIENVAINRLENTIEVKAISNSKAYYKIIKIGLPIKDYYFYNKKLILELIEEIK